MATATTAKSKKGTSVSNSKQKAKKPAEEQKGLFDHQQKVAQAADLLQQQCYEVELEINWFSTSTKLSGAAWEEMLAKAEASKSSVRGSKSLFSSKHESVKAANDAKRAIETYFHSVTIPLCKMPAREAAKAAESSEEGAQKVMDILSKTPGTRVILAGNVDEFEKTIKTLVGNLYASIKSLNAKLKDVIEFDRKEQGKFFNEDDYPEEVTATVRGPFYKKLGLDADFERDCPQAAARMKADLEARLYGTVELAVGDFAQNLLDVIETVGSQLRNRTRLMPNRKSDYEYLREAEVVELVSHDDNPDEVPKGHVCLQVRYKPEGKAKNDLVWLEPMPYEDYKTVLNPYTTDEKKKVTESTLDNLMEKLDNFRQVADMFGDAGKPLSDGVDKVRDLLKTAGSNSAEILEEMRQGSFFRKTATKQFGEVAEQLKSAIEVLPVKKKRRSIGKLKSR